MPPKPSIFLATLAAPPKLKLIFIISLVICCYSLKSFSLSNDEFNKINNKTPSEWLKKEIEELKNIKNLEIKTRTSVAAYHQYNYLLARENLTDHLEAKDKTNKIRQRLLNI